MLCMPVSVPFLVRHAERRDWGLGLRPITLRTLCARVRTVARARTHVARRDPPAGDPPPVPAEASGASHAGGGNIGRVGHGTGRRSGVKGPRDEDRNVEDEDGR